MNAIRWLAVAFCLAGCSTAPVEAQAPVARTEGWRHLFDEGPLDPGVGVLSFAYRARPPGSPDTLPLYRRREDPRPAGYVIRALDSIGSGTYVLEWPRPLTTNLIEFDYEIPGLPMDSVTQDEWVPVIAGFLPDATPVRAWARAPRNRFDRMLWREALPERDLFFRAAVTPAFFDAPDGQVAGFALVADDRDYILHPVEARDGWLRVRAVTPSDMCGDPESPRSAEVWVRYLDGRGRPLVWYHTRGC